MNKSIVTFTRGTLAQATPLWQYDYGQVLEINGLDLPATYQVHFCNCSDTQTITVLGNADGVLIPDNLLQTGKTVIAYIYLHTGADDGETEYKITIPVRPRPAPSDIPPTPEQQSALDEAIAALNSAVEDVEDIAEGIPDQIDAALEEAKESGEFDGEDGYSPTVTVNEIEGGHRVTITDESGDHVFDVLDGQGGGGTGDYDDLTDKPSVNSVTLSGNKTAADLDLEPEAMVVTVTDSGNVLHADKTAQQIAAASAVGVRVVAVWDDTIYTVVSAVNTQAIFSSALQGYIVYIFVDQNGNATAASRQIGTYSKPSGGIPKTDLASAVQTSLGKADTALQSAPVTSVNGQTGAVLLSIPSTASEVGAVAANQGTANANKVLTVNSSGVVVPEDTRFVVMLTPTAADYSGTMDKTVAEIAAAFWTGKKVVFKILSGANEATYADCTMQYSDSSTYPSFNGFIIYNSVTPNLLIFAFTGTTNDGTKATYSTTIYPLASGQWTGGSY